MISNLNLAPLCSCNMVQPMIMYLNITFSQEPSTIKVQSGLARELNQDYAAGKATFCRTPVSVVTEFVNGIKCREQEFVQG